MSNITQQARQATIGNILKKIKAGKIPTNRESEMLEEWEASQQSQSKNQLDADTTMLTAFFEVTRKTIAAWVKMGMPKEAHGIYNLKKCFDWWCENIERTKEDNDPTITALRADNLRIKNEREAMKRDTEKSLLIPKDDVKSEWLKHVVEIRQGLLSLPIKFSQILEGKSADEIRATVKASVYQLLEAFSRETKHTPKPKDKPRSKPRSKPKSKGKKK